MSLVAGAVTHFIFFVTVLNQSNTFIPEHSNLPLPLHLFLKKQHEEFKFQMRHLPHTFIVQTFSDEFWIAVLFLVATFSLPDDVPSTDWYLANAKMTGFYRVNYDDENWQRLLKQAEQDPNVRSILI